MSNTSIFLPDHQSEWVKRNLNNLSRYVQDKIEEDMKKSHIDETNNVLEQKRYFGMSLMFTIMGLGFGMIGLTFLSNTIYLYPSVFFIAIGLITIIYGSLGVHDYRNWYMNEKNGKKIMEG